MREAEMWLFLSELRRGQGLAEDYEEVPLTGLGATAVPLKPRSDCGSHSKAPRSFRPQ